MKKDVINIESRLLTGLIGCLIKKKVKKLGYKLEDVEIDYITLVRRSDDRGYRLHTKLFASIDDSEIEKIKRDIK